MKHFLQHILRFFTFIFIFFVFIPNVRAAMLKRSVFLDQKTVLKGFTVASDNGNLRLGIRDSVVTSEATVYIQTVTRDQLPPLPSDKYLVSPVYEYSLVHGGSPILKKPLWFFVRFQSSENTSVGLYVWDRNKQSWIRTPANVDERNSVIKGVTHLSYAVMGVFADNTVREGVASWYRDSHQPESASTNLYPIGTRLRVTHLTSGYTVDVKVVSTWSKDNTRVIDLERSAFEKLAGLGAGLIKVRLEPLK